MKKYYTPEQVDEMVDKATVLKTILVKEGKPDKEAKEIAFQFLKDLMERYDGQNTTA